MVNTSLAELFMTQMRYHEAETSLMKALDAYEREKGPDAEEIALVLQKLGVLCTSTARVCDIIYKFSIKSRCNKQNF